MASNQGLRQGAFAESLALMPHSQMRRRWLSVAGLLAVPLLGCGPSGFSFSGTSQPPVVGPASVASVERAPDGQRRLGELKVECTRVDVRAGLDGARLSDVSCSRVLLLAMLSEGAAKVGGSFLVAPHCTPGLAAGEQELEGTLRCKAESWGPADVAHFEAPAARALPVNVDPRAPAAPGAPTLGSVEEAWRVRVDFWPAPGRVAVAAIDPESVFEIDFPRVGQVSLGDVRTRCAERCSPESVRGAVRAAAARIGATHVVGVRCIGGSDEQQCLAGVAVAEFKDASLAEAR